MDQKERQCLWGVVLAVMFLAGCGGGREGPQPLGLFDNQQQNQNPSPSNSSAEGDPSQILSVKGLAMGASFTQEESASKGLVLAPSFGLESFVSKAGKASDIHFSMDCRSIDDMTEECSANAFGQNSGSMTARVTTHFTEFTQTWLAGTVDFIFRFDRFAFNEGICNAEVMADGVFILQV